MKSPQTSQKADASFIRNRSGAKALPQPNSRQARRSHSAGKTLLSLISPIAPPPWLALLTCWTRYRAIIADHPKKQLSSESVINHEFYKPNVAAQKKNLVSALRTENTGPAKKACAGAGSGGESLPPRKVKNLKWFGIGYVAGAGLRKIARNMIPAGFKNKTESVAVATQVPPAVKKSYPDSRSSATKGINYYL